MGLRVTPLTGTIGAAIEGVDLNKPIEAPAFEQLHTAFLEHGVLVFRDQHMGPQAQTAFGKMWGSPRSRATCCSRTCSLRPRKTDRHKSMVVESKA